MSRTTQPGSTRPGVAAPSGRSRSGWTRAGAAAGLLGAVLYVVGVMLAGMPPDPDDSTASVINHLQDRRTTVMAGVLLTVVALALLLWFLGYFRAMLAEAEASIGDPGAPLATVTLVAFVSLFALAGAGAIGLYAVTWRGAASVDPNLVRLTFDVSNLTNFAITSTVAALSVIAPSVVIARTRVLPRWLLVLAAVEVAINVAEITGLFVHTGWNAAGWVVGLGPIVWAVWLAAVSITMMARRAGRPPAAADLRVPAAEPRRSVSSQTVSDQSVSG